MMISVFLFVQMVSTFGQRRECPLSKYDGNWAFGTTQTFYVGDPFDGIGQIEVMRPGKRVQMHEKNRKWKLDGVQIKPGEVFTKEGKFVMTISSEGYETAYRIEVLPAKGPKRPVATVVSYPVQTEYKVGNHFYVDGIKVVAHDENGKEVPVEGKDITFFTSISNTLVGAGSQCGGGYKFSKPGKKVIEIRYKYVTIGKFTINVIDNNLSNVIKNAKSGSSNSVNENPKSESSTRRPAIANTKNISNGWYNLRVMYNYMNLDAAGYAELRKKSVNQSFYVENKGNHQVTLKISNGKYLGIAETIKNGVQVKAVNSPYLWNTYSENNADIFSLRPSSNTRMVVNASGEKNTDGTHIILWTSPDLNAPNNAEFRFIPVN
jgi:hypothetical protein